MVVRVEFEQEELAMRIGTILSILIANGQLNQAMLGIDMKPTDIREEDGFFVMEFIAPDPEDLVGEDAEVLVMRLRTTMESEFGYNLDRILQQKK